MKVYQDLRIGPMDKDLEEKFIAYIQAALADGWARDSEREKEVTRDTLGMVLYCFACSEKGKRNAARLFLAVREKAAIFRRLWVSNIVPSEVRELSYDQYNFILMEFFEKFAAPAASRLGIPLEVSAPDQTLEAWMSEYSSRLLRAFSSGANKSTGSSHPMDRDRWFNLLVQLHQLREEPNEEFLRRWFVEEEHWPEDEAQQLILEYEFARGLLKYYDDIIR